MIVLHARPSPGFRQAVDAIFGAGVVVHVDEAAPLDAVAGEITALLHVLTPVTGDFIASAPKLKLIQKLGVGVNTIALDAARGHGVAVCNMPGTNSQAVAEMALSLMMAVLRRTCFFDARTRAGEGWTADPSELDSVGEIAGRTVHCFVVHFGLFARSRVRQTDALVDWIDHEVPRGRPLLIAGPPGTRERLTAAMEVFFPRSSGSRNVGRA